jgi:hypothetical protein
LEIVIIVLSPLRKITRRYISISFAPNTLLTTIQDLKLSRRLNARKCPLAISPVTNKFKFNVSDNASIIRVHDEDKKQPSTLMKEVETASETLELNVIHCSSLEKTALIIILPLKAVLTRYI